MYNYDDDDDDDDNNVEDDFFSSCDTAVPVFYLLCVRFRVFRVGFFIMINIIIYLC